MSLCLERNALKLNVKKGCMFHYILISLNKEQKILMSGQQLEFVKSYNYLGYQIVSEMSFKPLSSHAYKLTLSKIQVSHKICGYLTIDSVYSKTEREDLQIMP